ncbi:MAG TPA: SRPBCC family protein [Thermoleophilaceae bacterium]|nr:SRPBCC family protein [Thermoleophilaceae bacterium]
MRTARAQAELVLTPEAALRLWSDVSRWPSFVEGFARALERDPDWPGKGAKFVWESTPAGRGRVTEKVLDSEGPDRFVTRVFEDRLTGTQTFRVVESEAGSRAELSLEYKLTKYGALSAVADAIFIRRAIRDSLRRTLFRFAVEAEEEAGLR